jgi:adenylate cyclase
MAAQDFKRRLTAILSADAKGYSRLMGTDEVTTVKTLKAYRQIMAEFVNKHRGRVVDSPGDNLLAEFQSVVDAVQCAIEIQEALKVQNEKLPDEQKMEFRIGVNLGDVIFDEDRIYGDGVNIAARLEGLADGGGICISGSAYWHVGNKIRMGCEYIGEHHVKNISKPVRVYKVWKDTEATECRVGMIEKGHSLKRTVSIAAAVIILLVGVGVIFWSYKPISSLTRTKDYASQEVVRPFSNKPSIAVLPFKNLSDDPAQAYFSDGITNDLITDLSKFRDLIVLASNKVFKYKGKKVDLVKVGQALGARYILDGSVQKSGKQVRINAQLIDAMTAQNIWADRYDRKFKDIFKLQDEIIETVARKLALKVDEAERERAMRKDTKNLEAYDYILRGYHQLYKRTRESNGKAKAFFKKAIDLDSNYASAYVGLAKVRRWDAAMGYTEFPDKAIQQAEKLLKKALSIDDSNTGAHTELGYVYMRYTEYDLAISELEQALELNPNDWRIFRIMAPVMLYSGRIDEALEWYHNSMRYDPDTSAGMLMNMGIAYLLKEQYDESVNWLKKSRAKWPNFLGNHIVLAAVYAQMDQLDHARQEANEVLRISPFFQVDFYGKAFRNFEHRTKIVSALRKAGLK